MCQLDYMPDESEPEGWDEASKTQDQDKATPPVSVLTRSNATDLLLRVQRAGVIVHPWRWHTAEHDQSSEAVHTSFKTIGRDSTLAASVSR
jgi:hypothetical protein